MNQYPMFRIAILMMLALMLSILPLPFVLNTCRPQWVLLASLYVQFFMPRYFSLLFTLIMGLSLDVLLSTILGQHAFALLLTLWVSSRYAKRFHFCSITQQMGLTLGLALLYQSTIIILTLLTGEHILFWPLVGRSMITAVLWPWLRLIHDSLKYKIGSSATQ